MQKEGKKFLAWKKITDILEYKTKIEGYQYDYNEKTGTFISEGVEYSISDLTLENIHATIAYYTKNPEISHTLGVGSKNHAEHVAVYISSFMAHCTPQMKSLLVKSIGKHQVGLLIQFVFDYAPLYAMVSLANSCREIRLNQTEHERAFDLILNQGIARDIALLVNASSLQLSWEKHKRAIDTVLDSCESQAIFLTFLASRNVKLSWFKHRAKIEKIFANCDERAVAIVCTSTKQITLNPNSKEHQFVIDKLLNGNCIRSACSFIHACRNILLDPQKHSDIISQILQAEVFNAAMVIASSDHNARVIFREIVKHGKPSKLNTWIQEVDRVQSPFLGPALQNFFNSVTTNHYTPFEKHITRLGADECNRKKEIGTFRKLHERPENPHRFVNYLGTKPATNQPSDQASKSHIVTKESQAEGGARPKYKTYTPSAEGCRTPQPEAKKGIITSIHQTQTEANNLALKDPKTALRLQQSAQQSAVHGTRERTITLQHEKLIDPKSEQTQGASRCSNFTEPKSKTKKTPSQPQQKEVKIKQDNHARNRFDCLAEEEPTERTKKKRVRNKAKQESRS